MLNVVLLTVICLSMFLQLAVSGILVFLGKSDEFIDENKRKQLIDHNNMVTVLVGTISVVNVFLNVFV